MVGHAPEGAYEDDLAGGAEEEGRVARSGLGPLRAVGNSLLWFVRRKI